MTHDAANIQKSSRALRFPPLSKGGAKGDFSSPNSTSRRRFLVGFAGAFLLPLLKVRPALAVSEKLAPLLREVAGNGTLKTGRVKLTLPPLAESGNSVPLKVQVESPMTAEDHVKSIHIFSEKNPRPVIARFHLSPRAGRAEVSTRVRLAGSQQIVVAAVMSDGSCWLGTADVVVTAAACIEGS